jgi:hypothetical protein
MHKIATKCNETLGKWCKNKHGASKIIDTLEMYQAAEENNHIGNEEVDMQVDKLRSNGKKEKEKVHISAGE